MSFITFNNLSRFEQGIKDVLIQKFNEVAEKSIQTVSGSNVKIQSGIINTAADDNGAYEYVEFDEPFDSPPIVVLTAMHDDVGAYLDETVGWYARLETRDATGFTAVCFGNSAASDYSVAVNWIAIGEATGDFLNETRNVPLDIQELYKPLIAPLSVSLTGFVAGSYLLYGEFYDELRVFVKVSKTTAMSGTTAIGTLPSGYRPTEAQTLTAYDTDGNVLSGITVTIGTDGAVAVVGNVGANVIVMASYKPS